MAVGADRLPPFNRVLQCAIQDRSGDFLLELGGYVTHHLKQTLEMKS
jgi:hypothetical protein